MNNTCTERISKHPRVTEIVSGLCKREGQNVTRRQHPTRSLTGRTGTTRVGVIESTKLNTVYTTLKIRLIIQISIIIQNIIVI